MALEMKLNMLLFSVLIASIRLLFTALAFVAARLTGLGPLHCLGAGLATIALAGVGAGIVIEVLSF